ncbi:MAG: hypothetical protein R3C12_25760 [Planctomycetaceae bacterium]
MRTTCTAMCLKKPEVRFQVSKQIDQFPPKAGRLSKEIEIYVGPRDKATVITMLLIATVKHRFRCFWV